MKIRLGFVSNSSSASFLLKAEIPMSDFCKLLYGDFNKEPFKKTLKDKIMDLKQEVENLKKTRDTFHRKMGEFWITQYEDQIKSYKGLLRILNDHPTLDECVYAWFEFHGYGLQVHGDETIVRGHTTMYNDENDLGELFLDVEKKLKNNKIYFTREVENEG